MHLCKGEVKMRMMMKLAGIMSASLLMTGCVIVADVNDDGEDNLRIGNGFGKSLAASSLSKSKRSYKSFEATLADLSTAIDSRGLKTFAVVDHAAGAASVDKTLPPTTLVIFGNPKAGTPLMKERRSIGMALPLKAMVWEKGDKIFVTITDIDGLASAYDIDEADGVIEKIGDTLAAVLIEATE